MATFSVFVRKYPLHPQRSTVIIEVNHKKNRWRLNTQLVVNAYRIGCIYDDDINRYRLHSLTTLTSKEKDDLKAANTTIQSIQEKLETIIKELIFSQAVFVTENIKELYYCQPEEKPQNIERTLAQWYQDFIKYKETEIKGAINSYRSTWRHFGRYSSSMGTLYLKNLDRRLLDGFRIYLRDLDLKGSTINKQFKNLKIFLNWIKNDDEYNQIEIPQAIKKIKIKWRFGDPIGLSVNQFNEFAFIDLSQRPELERTRDLMVFGISIGGPRHGDLRAIAESLRRNGYTLDGSIITYFERKTGNQHKDLIINKFGLQVLKKYHPLFPYVPSNQRMNVNLKVIASILEWNEIKVLPKYDEFGRLIEVEEKKLKDIFSTRFMRKTAATIDNYLGIPAKTSMYRTGHKTFAAFSRYVDVNQDSINQANEKWDNLYEEYDARKS